MSFRLSLRTLHGKILLVIVGLCAAMGLTFSIFLQTQVREKLHEDLKEKGVFIAKQLAEAVVDPILTDNHLLLNMVLQEFTEADHDIAYIYIRATDGRILAHTFGEEFPEAFLNLPPLSAAEEAIQLQHYEMGEEVVGDFAAPLLSGQLGFVHLGLSEKTMRQDIRRFTLLLQGVLFVLCLAGGTIAMVVASSVTRPLRALAHAVSTIGQGNFQEMTGVSTADDEVAQLTRRFNAMARRLAEYHSEMVRSQEELEKEIAEQQQTELALRQNEEMFRSLSENSSDFIIRFDRSLNHLYANGAYAGFVGMSADELAGQPFAVAGFDPHSQSRIVRNLREVFETGRPLQWEMELHREPESVYLDWRVTPEDRSEGKVTSALAVCRDISIKKRMEHEMLRVQNLESLGTFAGGIAHDFNNLLTMVFGNIDLALMHVTPNTKLARWLQEAARASEQAQHLTGQLLTFSRGGAPVKEKGPIDVTLRETVSFALSGTSIEYRVTVPRDLWSLEFDKGQMRQVFSNITLNALQAMPDGGTLEVVASNESLPAEMNLLPPGPHIRISFRDTGSGIEPDVLPRVFDPYFTTKGMTAHRGTGLGLSICYSIIQQHAGHIAIESTLQQGTTVTLYLPADPKAGQVPPERSSHEPKISVTSRKALLMEDEEGVAAVGRTLLETLGWESVWAPDGDEAIRLYEKTLKIGAPFPVAILDLTIRGGRGGRETAAEILKLDPEARLVVASGFTNDDAMTHYEASGFKAAVRKPYTAQSLSAALERALGNPKGKDRIPDA